MTVTAIAARLRPAVSRPRVRLPDEATAAHRAAFVLLLLGIWEALVRFDVFDQRFVAPPTAVAGALWYVARDTEVLLAMRDTGTAVLYAAALAAAVGVTVGFALGLNSFLHRTFIPVANVLFAWPKMVMTPFFVLFFGFGIASKTAFAFSLGLFPVMFNAVEGAQSASPTLRQAATAMGAGRWQLFRAVVVPSSVPSVLRGVRLGVNYSLLGVILAELYGATTGVAVFIQHYTLRLQRDRLFAVFFLVSLIAITINSLLARAERYLQAWRA